MPRIEIIPKDWEKSKEKERGDGTPTIDTCCICSYGFVEGGELPNAAGLRHRFPDAVVGSCDVDHPPYSEGDYRCEVCEEPLIALD